MQVVGVAGSGAAVDAVTGDDQVDLACQAIDISLGLELDTNAEFEGSARQDLEQPHPGQRSEAVTVGGDRPSPVADVHRAPVTELRLDRSDRIGIGLGEVGERLVGEHHAEPERVAAAVALVHGDVVVRVLLGHQDAEEQARRTAPDAGDLHRGIRSGFIVGWTIHDIAGNLRCEKQ
ncbi:MAG: hypothetical protein F4Y76_02715 [Acidimicrobiales bacterium]|nr:hypothetical protein [Acidimicrobiales bacterium]